MKRNAHLILLFALAMLAACSPPVSRTAASPLGAPAAATPIPTTYAYGKEVTAKYTIRGGPFGITAGFGSLWVTGRRAHQLYRVDPASGEIRTSIPVGLAPGPVIAAAESLWVGNFGTNPGEQSIARVDPQKEQATATVKLNDFCCDLAANDSGLWMLDHSGTLSRIDLKTLKLKTFALPAGSAASGPVISEDAVWTAGDQLVQFELKTSKVKASVPIGGSVLAYGGGFIWISDGSSVWTVTGDKAEPAFQVSPGEGVSRFESSASGGRAGAYIDNAFWVVGIGDSGRLLVKIDPATQEIVKTILIGPSSASINQLAPLDGAIWVTDEEDNLLLKIEPGA